MITGLDPDPLKTGIVTPLVKTIFWDRRGDRRRDVDCCRIPREHASRHYSAGREKETVVRPRPSHRSSFRAN